MLENLRVSFNIVFPFLVYMSLGYFLKRIGVVDDPFLRKLNRFLALVLFPINVFNSLYKQPLDSALRSPVALYCGVGIILFTLLMMGVVRLWERDPAKQGAMVHCGYRSNCTFYALPISQGIFGTVVPEVAIGLAVVVLVNNVEAVPLLEHYQSKIQSGEGPREKTKISLKHILLGWLKVPLLDAMLIGTLWSLLDIPMPDFCGDVVGNISATALPLAFMVLGGRMNFGHLKKNRRNIFRTVSMKLVVSPLIFLILPLLMHWTPQTIVAVLGAFATPTAVVAYAMTEQFGCDGEMAGGMVSLSSALSLITIFLWVFGLKQMGFVP